MKNIFNDKEQMAAHEERTFGLRLLYKLVFDNDVEVTFKKSKDQENNLNCIDILAKKAAVHFQQKMQYTSYGKAIIEDNHLINIGMITDTVLYAVKRAKEWDDKEWEEWNKILEVVRKEHQK